MTAFAGWSLHSYLTLLLAGLAVPFDVTMNAVSSYLTVSPLPRSFDAAWRFIFCGAIHRLALKRTIPRDFPLSG